MLISAESGSFYFMEMRLESACVGSLLPTRRPSLGCHWVPQFFGKVEPARSCLAGFCLLLLTLITDASETN